ncbi:hypothetical protein M5K25_028255 [Dendrobium thyrsiflorum]|uniref:Small ribosomal subunit protein uS10 domain-containing protein n=1 Tax=Dendrobium thyrsiflorum TaxID=117978 RepID=A0ABD0TTQ7_DENTH
MQQMDGKLSAVPLAAVSHFLFGENRQSEDTNQSFLAFALRSGLSSSVPLPTASVSDLWLADLHRALAKSYQSLAKKKKKDPSGEKRRYNHPYPIASGCVVFRLFLSCSSGMGLGQMLLLSLYRRPAYGRVECPSLILLWGQALALSQRRRIGPRLPSVDEVGSPPIVGRLGQVSRGVLHACLRYRCRSSPSFLLRHKTENTSSSAQASDSRKRRKERPPKVTTTKMRIMIRSFDNPFFENHHFWGLTRDTRKIGLPESRVLYTVLRSPHIDKKSREQFEMEIKTKFLVIKTETHELRKKFFRIRALKQAFCRTITESLLSALTNPPVIANNCAPYSLTVWYGHFCLMSGSPDLTACAFTDRFESRGFLFLSFEKRSEHSFFHRRVDRQDQWLATGLVCEVKPGSTDAGTGKDASTSLAAGDGSFTEATLLCCSASTESIYC